MNYLNPLRLHFAGQFQASVSTVNNDPLHFDNSHFIPAYQERQTGSKPDELKGWWNPGGDAAWRLIGCRVTSAWRADGSPVDKDDSVLRCLIADSDRRVAAKLVDLDPEQQLVSEIWGLEVRICEADGKTLLRGRFAPAAFMDIWDRAAGGGGDIGAGAMYQSVLSELEWGNVSSSPFLHELRGSVSNGMLSIKFNVDGYNMDYQSPQFTRGRIVGTIGPTNAGEPWHFVRGRQFMTTGLPNGNFFAPMGGINFCAAVVNQTAGKVYLDVGNALPTERPGGDLMDLGTLSLVCQVGDGSVLPVGNIPYKSADWYERTAGVIELPANRCLTDKELKVILQNPLALLLPNAARRESAASITEPPGGAFVRADQFVFRLDPGETAEVQLFATRFGLPYAGGRIICLLDPNGLQLQINVGTDPPVATPTHAIDFASRLVTDDAGRATLLIAARDPGNPRSYIDGQVYGVRPALEEALVPATNYPSNPWHFVSLLVHSSFSDDEPPTWYGSLQPVFQQYANLYPVMKRLLDLSDYESIRANRRLLQLAFSLDPTDPNSMPVTRDLSKAKRRTILRWLANDPPLKGNPPPVVSIAATPASATMHVPPVPPARGGKASAASRRLGLRRGRISP